VNHGEKPLQNHRASLTALRHLDCAALDPGIHAPGHCQYLARLKSWTARNLIQYLAARNVKQILDQLAFYKKAHKGDRAYQFWQERGNERKHLGKNSVLITRSYSLA
jgi:hypothetical protein